MPLRFRRRAVGFAAALAAALPLMLPGGCSQPNFDEPAAPTEQLFAPDAMRIHPIFTEVKDWTNDGVPDGFEVLLEFQDRFGDPTKAAGTVMFELFGYRPANPDPRDIRLDNPWIGSITTADEQTARWNRTSRTYSFQLVFPRVDATKSYVLTAQFREPSGKRFFDQVVMEGIEPLPPATQPTTQPATQPATMPATMPTLEMLEGIPAAGTPASRTPPQPN